MGHYKDIKIDRSEGWKYQTTVGTNGDDYQARVYVDDKGEIFKDSYSREYNKELEEKGCIGSNRADMSFFKDSLYVLEPDCKGGTEIHTNLRGIPCASLEFEKTLQVEQHGYLFDVFIV